MFYKLGHEVALCDFEKRMIMVIAYDPRFWFQVVFRKNLKEFVVKVLLCVFRIKPRYTCITPAG